MIDEKLNKEIQEKYEKCVDILDNIHNAIALALSLSSEFDDKTATEVIQYALDQYIEFDNMSDTERLKLEADSEQFMDEIKKFNPDIEIVDTKPKKQNNNGLPN